MSVIKNFWKDIAKKLRKEHPEAKPPAEWTKSEALSFSRKLQSKTDKSISPTTFRRIFKEGHLGKLETKDIFAQYFDYPTHGDYINEEIKKKKINWYWMFLIPVGLTIAMTAKNWTSLTAKTTYDESEIITVIEKAVKNQFIAFKAIPNYKPSLENLKEVYLTNGSAYQEIESILTRQSNLNWMLNNPSNASTAQLVKVAIDSVSEDRAFVTTIEHWRLDWFNQSAHRDEYKYEATNEQKYILVKGEGAQQWKILQNNYSGDKFRYVPKYIHCDSIAAATTDLLIVKKRVRSAVENDGLGLALKIITCYYSNNEANKNPNALSLLLAEKTKLLRAVNTDEIDKTEFELRKSALFEQILDFTENL